MSIKDTSTVCKQLNICTTPCNLPFRFPASPPQHTRTLTRVFSAGQVTALRAQVQRFKKKAEELQEDYDTYKEKAVSWRGFLQLFFTAET